MSNSHSQAGECVTDWLKSNSARFIGEHLADVGRIIPDDLTREELAVVNIVLWSIKNEILKARYSGQVIDQALEELVQRAIRQ